MKTFISILVFLVCSLLTYSQKTNQTTNKHVQFNIGKSFHGTGDMRGVAFNFMYTHYFTKKLSWNIDFGATIHDDSDPLYYTTPSGFGADGTIRYTTAGIQSSFGLGYSFLKIKENELGIKLNGLFRYQTTSIPDVLTILYPAGTGLPIPVVYFEQYEPARTVSIGAIGSLYYNYTFSKNISIGLLGNFQLDTNGDVLSQLGITVGKKF